MSRQPRHLLQAKSSGRRLVHQSRGVVVHFQHLGDESRGKATVGPLRFLIIATLYFFGCCAAGHVLFPLFSSKVGYLAALEGKWISLHRVGALGFIRFLFLSLASLFLFC